MSKSTSVSSTPSSPYKTSPQRNISTNKDACPRIVAMKQILPQTTPNRKMTWLEQWANDLLTAALHGYIPVLLPLAIIHAKNLAAVEAKVVKHDTAIDAKVTDHCAAIDTKVTNHIAAIDARVAKLDDFAREVEARDKTTQALAAESKALDGSNPSMQELEAYLEKEEAHLKKQEVHLKKQ